MNITLKLLRIIGSPFCDEKELQLPKNKNEALELYNYASINKIGLLFLEALKDVDKLESFALRSKWEKERKKHDEQKITAVRIADILNSLDAEYVIFKSILPFPATPNDVDILFLDSDDKYWKVVELLPRVGYKRIEEVPSPSEVMFHDTRVCEHTDIRKKDVYDVDLYREAGASHIIYLDKRKLRKYQTEIELLGKKVKVLKPEAELVAIITHSIIPEQLFTLLAYYATLHYLANKNFNVDKFICIARENSVTFPVRVHCSLSAILHKMAHGFIPEEINEILYELGIDKREVKYFMSNNLKMSHRYSIYALIRTIIEKSKENKFRKSLVKQMIFMSNPKLAKWVIKEMILRRRRETY